MASRDERRREASEYLAERIATCAEPALAGSLTKGQSIKVDSETAHRLAAKVARDADRRAEEK